MAPADPNPPRTLSVGASWLLAAVCLLYIATMLLILGSEPVVDCGDAASCGITKGLGQAAAALAGFFTVLLWIVLGILLLSAGGIKEETTRGVAAALFLLSGIAAIYGGALYSRYAGWAIAVPALLPPLIVLYAIWVRLPVLHAALPAKIVNPAAAAAILILMMAPFPLSAVDANRYAAQQQQRRTENEALFARRQRDAAQESERKVAKFQALSADSPLGDYLDDLYFPYPYAAGEAHHREALTKARQVKSRQNDAATLLKEGKIGWLEELWNLDIEATPAICQAYGDALRQEAAKLEMRTTNEMEAVERQLPNMKWLVGAHCDLAAALGLVETRFREWCDRHQCRRSDTADRTTFTILDTLAALRRPH